MKKLILLSLLFTFNFAQAAALQNGRFVQIGISNEWEFKSEYNEGEANALFLKNSSAKPQSVVLQGSYSGLRKISILLFTKLQNGKWALVEAPAAIDNLSFNKTIQIAPNENIAIKIGTGLSTPAVAENLGMRRCETEGFPFGEFIGYGGQTLTRLMFYLNDNNDDYCRDFFLTVFFKVGSQIGTRLP